MDRQCNKAELEGHAYEMSWDWDAKDINLDEDDRRMWVPITPKTLEDEALQTMEVKWVISEDEEELHTIKNIPHQMMSMYAVTRGPTGVMRASHLFAKSWVCP